MGKRRGNNEGSIIKRKDGRWMARVSLGIVDGKYQRKTVYGRTREEAAEKMRREQEKIHKGMPVRSSTPRLGEFLDEWILHLRRRVLNEQMAPSTYRSYEGIVRTHIKPDLGHIRLEKLTQHHVNRLLDRKLELAFQVKRRKELEAKGMPIPKDLPAANVRMSASRVDNIRRVLRAALGTAVKWDLIGRNVASLSDPPRVPEFEGRALTRTEASTFIRTVQDKRNEALYRTALALGMRQGEVLGLGWDEVDLDQGEIDVKWQLQVVDGVYVLRELKTVKSRRKLPLPRRLQELLRRHRTTQKEERLKAGVKWNGSWNLVFMTPIGTPIDAANLRKDFYKCLEEAGIERMRFHDLRHSTISFLAAEGAHTSVQQAISGHSQRRTVEHYTHAQLENMRQALEASSESFEPEKEAK